MKKNLLFFVLMTSFVIGFSQARYYKTQMHCHTTNSDGGYSPQDLALKYKNAGYEIIMITDHNHLTLENEVDVPGMLVIQSEELTFERHMNGFFLNSVIEPTESYTCQDAINDVKAQNGLIMLNHYCEGPITNDSWAVGADEILTFNGLDMLEIWNTGTETIQTNDDKSIWDAVLTAGKVVWGSATDDFHPSVIEALEFNKGWNMIWLDSLCPLNVYDALQNGRFYASTGVNITNYQVQDMGTSKIINIASDNATKILFWGPNHQKILQVNSNTASFVLQNYDYIRVELIKEGILGTGKTYAWTQPIFLNTSTEIGMDKNLASISISPNPTNSFTNVKVNLPHAQSLSIIIKDISGRTVKSVFEGFANDTTMSVLVDVSTLNSGIYFVSLETENGVFVKKFIVN